MAIRKNKKRIDPRYFLHETTGKENTKELDEVFGLFGDSKLEKLVKKYRDMFQQDAQKGKLSNRRVPDSFPSVYSDKVTSKGPKFLEIDPRGAPEEHIEAVIDFLVRAYVANFGEEDNIAKMGEPRNPLSVTSKMVDAYKYFFNPDRNSWEKDKERQRKAAAYKQGAPGREKAATQRRAGKQQELLNALAPWKKILDRQQNGVMSLKGIIRHLNRDGTTDLNATHHYLKAANAALRAATQLLRTPEGKKALLATTSGDEGYVQDLTKIVQHLKQMGRDEESVRSRDKHVDDREVATDTHYGAGGARKRKSDFQRTQRFNESQLKEIIKKELEAALAEAE